MNTKDRAKKYRAVLADNNREYLRLVKDYLEQTGEFNVVDYAFEGKQAIELTMKIKPDLLVIDLILPVLDCFAVLEELCKQGYEANTRIVLTSAVGLDFVLKKAETFGIDYIFLKPFKREVFQKRILEIMTYCNGIENKSFGNGKCDRPVDIVTRHIKMVGITANIMGYQYLREAILLVYKDFDLISRLTTDLYVQIAEKYKSTPQRVERAMRHAIETGFSRAELKVLESFFGYTIHETKGKPTNGEFIAMLADKLNTELKHVD